MNFEKYIEAKYPNRSPKILFQKFEDIDGTLFYGVKEIEDQAEVWNHQQAIINALKAQLECCRKENAVLLGKLGELQGQLENMEACYIEKKKQVEDALHILDELYRKGLFAKPKAVSEAISVLRGEHETN